MRDYMCTYKVSLLISECHGVSSIGKKVGESVIKWSGLDLPKQFMAEIME